MTQENETFHQQILFDDVTANTNTDASAIDAAIIVNNQDYQEAQLHYIENEEQQESDKKPRWLWRFIILALVVITVIEAVVFLVDGFTSSPVITSLYGALFAAIALVSISVLVKEFRGLRSLKQQELTRHQVTQILSGNGEYAAEKLCQGIYQNIAFDFPESTQTMWQASLDNQMSEQEQVQLFDLKVLSQVDEKAIADIAKYSSETMVLVAISPLALMDMLIMLWRNIRMIDKISGLYGLKLGYWSRLKLIKQVFVNMAFVGASEMMIDLGSEALGADLLGKFSGRMAQGFGAGMLTARLGLNTIKTCRPLPFIEQAPQLSNVRKALLSQVKGMLLAKK